MSGRQVGWVSGAAVVLAAVNSALINELHGSWRWWVGAVAVTALGAAAAAWLAGGHSARDDSVEVDSGGVFVGQENAGQIYTAGGKSPEQRGGTARRVWRRVGPGGVLVSGGNRKGAVIDTRGKQAESPKDGR